MPSLSSKQPLLGCSCCPSTIDVSLLGCCLVLNCQSCLKEHSCESPLTILPLPLELQTKLSPIKKCNRCNKSATVVCQSCRGKLFCPGCSKAIHQSKFSSHTFNPILAPQPQTDPSSVKLKRKQLTFDGTMSPRASDRQNKQNLQGLYDIQMLQNKLNTKIMQSKHFKEQIQLKQASFQGQIKKSFNKVRFQLDMKEQDVLFSMSEVFRLQLQTVSKLVRDLEISSKALDSLVHIGDVEPPLAYLSKSKKVHILQDIKRIDKRVNVLDGIQYRYLEGSLLALSNQITSLNLFERHKASQLRHPDSTSTITDRSDRIERLQSKSINSRALPALMKKTSALGMSINLSHQSLIESPKSQANNSLHSSRFNKKNQITHPENSASVYCSPQKPQKTETIRSSNWKNSHNSNRLEECRSTKRLGSASFAPLSPSKPSRKIHY